MVFFKIVLVVVGVDVGWVILEYVVMLVVVVVGLVFGGEGFWVISFEIC